ncbi:ABC transporter ATP-binding protein [Pediococcus acidilactici]|nr:ABC transporter ATP-binding protein [Pediococcus acidilactici]KAF0342790.1 ABC transporter ATP-binding protein [Pediococcus acidilactici]KAF0382454.1 ABC transporter ATP-binding protein [Pediococcus acidilactici]KAF0411972.1 ABC transporter ATP-binding protein [Pediococcus acidilactici]KAF0424597.1 ABC transporter ATP-binding protein [Pediococcus acidilactici]
MVNTILKEADLFCPNSVRINSTIYNKSFPIHRKKPTLLQLISYLRKS